MVRRKVATVSAFWLIAALCAGCGGGRRGGASDSCGGFELDVEKVWNAGIRAEVMGYGGSVDADMNKKVVTGMDAVTRDWVMLREAACRDNERGLISDAEYAAQVKCFDAFLQRLRTFVVALQASDGASGADSVPSAQDVTRCQ